MKVKLLLIEHPEGDWYTLYVNGERVTHGHNVDSDDVVEVLKHLGYEVNSEYKELSEELSEQYDGDYLPEKLSDLGM